MSLLKFYSNKLLSFEDIQIFIFLRLGWDCLTTPRLTGFGEFEPLNVVSRRADPQKAQPCVTPRNLSHCASVSADGSLQ